MAAISSYGRSQLYLRCKATEWPKVQLCVAESNRRFTGWRRSPRQYHAGWFASADYARPKGSSCWSRRWRACAPRESTWILSWPAMGRCVERLKQPLNVSGLENSVRITGWISSDGVRDEILAARALVLPSFAEGLPVVIMEAMALRRPVLSTYVAGIPELVRDGENGWLFPAGSLDELTAAMEDCLSRSVEEIQRMGDAGHRQGHRTSFDRCRGRKARRSFSVIAPKYVLGFWPEPTRPFLKERGGGVNRRPNSAGAWGTEIDY